MVYLDDLTKLSSLDDKALTSADMLLVWPVTAPVFEAKTVAFRSAYASEQSSARGS